MPATPSNVLQLFNRVNENHHMYFELVDRGYPGNLPAGINDGMAYHQEGIQRLNQGGFVVSGAAPANKGVSYFYVTDSRGEVIAVEMLDAHFTHAGGIQVAGNILGIGVEQIQQPQGGSLVLFYDLTMPARPQRLRTEIPGRRDSAGGVGIAEMPSGGHMVVVANWGAAQLDFYIFRGGVAGESGNGVATVSMTPATMQRQSEVAMGGDNAWESYENINLFYDQGGVLWLVGMHSNTALQDFGDLWRVDIDIQSKSATLTKCAKKHFICKDGARFRYGGGYFYDQQQDRFRVYVCEAHFSGNGVSRCNAFE